MFKPLAMKHVTVFLLADLGPKAALALARRGVFHPDDDVALRQALPDLPGRGYRERFHAARTRLARLQRHYGLDGDAIVLADVDAVATEAELARLADRLHEMWAGCAAAEDEVRTLTAEHRHVRQLQHTLDNFAALDVDLARLRGGGRFLDVQLGTVARASVARLRQALGLAGYVLETFLVADDTAYVIAAGPKSASGEVSATLRSAGWQAVDIPPEFGDHPGAVRRELEDRLADLRRSTAAIEAREAAAGRQAADELGRAARTLMAAAPYVRLAETALCKRGAVSGASGWMPAGAVERLSRDLGGEFPGLFVLEARDPTPQERAGVPSVSHHPRWLQPFASLVRTYGVPRYGEFDPTWLFAVTFTLMFGMMFGDVGQGIVIAMAAWLLRRRLRRFTAFAVTAGLACAVFGLLYGSVFGLEDVIAPVWMAPLSDPVRLLLVALGWGVAFIVLATLIAVYNRACLGLWRDALLDGGGVAGLAFYLALLACGYAWFAWGGIPVALLALPAVPLGVIAADAWRRQTGPRAERAVVVAVETFDTVLGFLSNTLSFLRVAAFGLNHAALAIAVLTLAQMTGGAGHWATFVLGNLFIIVLEGAIVLIQTLRLEYYEGFSRFFSGDGRAFRPLRPTLDAQP